MKQKLLFPIFFIFFLTKMIAQDPFPSLHSNGTWPSFAGGAHTLIRMQDGRVLDWMQSNGTWKLWNYTPSSLSDCLPTSQGNGVWPSLVGYSLYKMKDGKVLAIEKSTGTWKLWNYDPNVTNDCLPTLHSSNNNFGNQSSSEIIVMGDGKVLFWTPSSGNWALWDYTPANTSDCLATSVGGNVWPSIVSGHELIPMPDGKVLDFIPTTGAWRLFGYDPNVTTDCLPTLKATGTFLTINNGHKLISMHDGKVLDWMPANGTWRLWNYDGNVTTSIENSNLESLNIYPNPVKESVFFKVDLLKNVPTNISLTNIQGEELYKKSEKDIIGKYEMELDMSSFPTGVYFIKAQLGAEVVTEKIIKE